MRFRIVILLLLALIIGQKPYSLAHRDYKGNIRPVITANDNLFAVYWDNNGDLKCYRVILNESGEIIRHKENIDKKPVEFWANQDNEKYNNYAEVTGISNVLSFFQSNDSLTIYGIQQQSLNTIKIAKIKPDNSFETKVIGDTYRTNNRLIASNILVEGNNCYICWIEKANNRLVISVWNNKKDIIKQYEVTKEVIATNTLITMAILNNTIGIAYHEWDKVRMYSKIVVYMFDVTNMQQKKRLEIM